MSDKKSVAVIGAGISGLSVAYWLQKNGLDVTVFEKSQHIGGSIVTEKQDGFLIDLGPNSTLETSQVLKDLVRELGLEDQKVYGNEASNNRYVVRGGQLHPIPMSPGKFLTTRLFSGRAKLRLLKEPFIKPTEGSDISLADFVRHRLGEEFLDYAINPFVAGVYAGDPETLSTAAAFPKLYALEKKYGSFIRGTIKGSRERKKRNEVAKDRARLFSFLGGMETLPRAIAAGLGQKVHTGRAVEKIEPTDSRFTLHFGPEAAHQKLEVDEVVLSTPTDSLAGLLAQMAQTEAAQLKDVFYPPVAVVFMGVKEEQVQRPLDGFGFLIPKKENRKILGSIWSSTIFPARAPEGFAAFTTFVGGTRQPQMAGLDDDDLRKIVLEDLTDLIGLTGHPVLTRIKRWPRAIPQYTLGYGRIQRIFDDLEEKFPGLWFAGNYRRGISVGDSVLCAHETVQKILKKQSK